MSRLKNLNRPVIRSFAAYLILTPSVVFADPRHPESADDVSGGGIELVGSLRISGDATDGSGMVDSLGDGSPANRFGGLSGIEFVSGDDATVGGNFLLLADRGAGDGAVDYPCRFHEAALTLDLPSKTIAMTLTATRPLVGSDGASLVGSLTQHAIDMTHHAQAVAAGGGAIGAWQSMDPEGVRRLDNGSYLISDEYGPRLAIFDPRGRLVRSLDPTTDFRITSDTVGESDRGACPNRGFEGVAVWVSDEQPTRYLAAIQSPLLQDGVIREDKCLGINCRFPAFDAEGNAGGQFVYQLDSQKAGVSEILAVDPGRFLVLERDSKAGVDAKIKRIFLVDARDATDVSSIDALPVDNLPENVVPMRKQLLIDLLDPRFGLAGSDAGEKPEGLAWGSDLPDGRRSLWVVFDNDFETHRDTEIYCFAIDAESLTQPKR